MIYICSVFIFIFCFFVFFLQKKEWVVVVFFAITIFSLFALNRQNQDYNAYVEIFNDPSSYAEPGYTLVVYFLKAIGGGHNSLLLILAGGVLITLYRLYSVLAKYKYSYFFSFLFLYFIFPLPIDIVQIRNTMSTFLFLNAVLFLIEKRVFLSIFFIILSPLFHVFGLLYVIMFFYLALRVYGWKWNNVFLNASIIFSLFIGGGLPKLTPYFDNVRTLSYYISSEVKYHSFFIWGAVYILDLVVINFLSKKANKKLAIDESNFIILNNLKYLFFSFLLFLPLILYVDEFNRFFRTALLVKYALFLVISPYISFKYRVGFFMYIFMYTALLGTYYLFAIDYDYILFGA